MLLIEFKIFKNAAVLWDTTVIIITIIIIIAGAKDL